MATPRRILKYTPAVMVGLLLIVWVGSVGREFGLDASLPVRGRVIIGSENGTCYVGYNHMAFTRVYYYSAEHPLLTRTSQGFGRLKANLEFHSDGRLWRWWFDVPIAFLVSICLPLAIGPFISFRFRLWHYLAYTALVAVELAYYLRWQE
jgi:hypothetical protein